MKKDIKLFISSMSQVKKVSAADILKRKNPEASMPVPTYAEIMAKIAKLEKEAEVALAVETFLDCDYKKVKISKRVAIVPKYARGVCK
jgi:Cys-tRNA synthase (O-phospho-L-seryl-tRNA:Cys-tRNA synthase)